ncbi:MAG: alpha/beta fold hydrolase [Sphingobacteriia bacterium]|jgi:pimeloyl-ACP methyl ester carboxylesterase
MKKIIITTCIILLFSISNAQTIIGSWGGKIDIGARKILFVMHVQQNGTSLKSIFDSPDQNAFDIRGGETKLVGDSIIALIPAMQGGYMGKWDGKDSIAGVFKQGQRTTILGMKRLNESAIPKPPIAKNRPQTPKPPFDYSIEEVEYNNADNTVRYGATLTTPKNITSFPTVILISGSGSQDRDGTMLGHKLYWVLADYLTKNGIGVLRVDDRGTGVSTLGPDPKSLTSADFANDVANSVQFLLSRKEIDAKKIGLVGHSEGGAIAPMVASTNKNIAFITLLAGPGVNGDVIFKYQMRRNFVKKGLSIEDEKIASGLVNDMIDQLKKSSNYDSIKTGMKNIYTNWRKTYSESDESRVLNTIGDKAYLAVVDQFRGGLIWLNYFMNMDPSIALKKVKCPVLAVNGESDMQVVCKENLEGIENALQKGKNKKYTIHSFPNLNHLFQTCNNPEQSYESIDETFSPTALAYIANWINQIVK